MLYDLDVADVHCRRNLGTSEGIYPFGELSARYVGRSLLVVYYYSRVTFFFGANVLGDILAGAMAEANGAS